LECRKLVELIASLSLSEREWMLARAVGTLTQREQHEQELRHKLGLRPRPSARVPSRFVPLPVSDFQSPGNVKAEPVSLAKIQSWEQADEFPPIPAVCVAASWFPKHWLEGMPQKRRAIV
jgi:hypothetical protein